MSDKVQKQISWFLVAKNLVKFVNDENSYKLSEKVMAANDFKKYPLLKGDTADISIEDGVVTYLRKVKKDTNVPPTAEQLPKATTVQTAPPPEPKVVDPNPVASVPSTNPQVVGEVKELTVFAVSANKRVVKFLEIKDSGWFQIDPSIQAKDYQEIGLQAKNKVKVTFNDKTVISVVKVTSEPAEQPKTTASSPETAKVEPTAAPAAQTPVQAPKKEWKPQSSYQGKEDYWAEKARLDKEHYDVKDSEKQKSIEAQSAVNAANEVAAQVAAAITNASRNVDKDGNVTTNAPTANIINRMIEAISLSNYKLIQTLKNEN